MFAAKLKHAWARLSRVVLMTSLAVTVAGGSVPATRPIFQREFQQVAPQGLGDRQNTMAWSMQWWKGKLYVGTGRAYGCVRQAILGTYFPEMAYPPLDPELECAESPQDLPLRAEIWRLTPETGTWERVYLSPTVPISDTGKTVGVDIGYRDMALFTEPDGTEALYVGGFTSRDFNPGVPPPRILRSVDGIHFEAIPQDKGTLLGDLDEMEGITITGFNRLAVHNGRMYAVAGGAFGHGVLLEARTPAGGNDNFQVVTPAGMTVTGAASYNGQLYVAQGSNPLPDRLPFTVYRTDPTGALPYDYIPVLNSAGYRENGAKSAASLYVFDNRLWVGTNRPVELIRINPDDSWDLIVGTARRTPEGLKYPLSGIGDGFAWPLNIHIHQMQSHDGWLYASTNDQSNVGVWHLVPFIEAILKPNYGFDMYATQNGWYFYLITRTGLELYSLSYSARTFASTPDGLYLGTLNDHYGLQLWRGAIGGPYYVFLPFVSSAGTSLLSVSLPGASRAGLPAPAGDLASPTRLQLDESSQGLILSWELGGDAATYGVYRSDFAARRYPEVSAPEMAAEFPSAFRRIATAQGTVYLDTTAVPGRTYQYYVVAERSNRTSQPSNLVQAPVATPPLTVQAVEELLATWIAPAAVADKSPMALAQVPFDDLSQAIGSGDLDAAAAKLEELSEILTAGHTGLPYWRGADVRTLMDRFARRLNLARMGLIDLQDLVK